MSIDKPVLRCYRFSSISNNPMDCVNMYFYFPTAEEAIEDFKKWHLETFGKEADLSRWTLARAIDYDKPFTPMEMTND